MNRRTLALCLGSIALAFACNRTQEVSLSLDFSKAHTWRYLFAVDIKGAMQSPDSTREFSTSLRTYLTGEHPAHDSGAVRLRTGSAIITADFLADAEKRHLEKLCENQILYLSPREGTIEAVDTALPALVNVGGWDLFRSFARVLPVLPDRPQRVGATWDRERTIPLETSKGDATGWLYQSFTLDSVSGTDSSRSAWVSWRFTYKIDPPKHDTATFLDTLPLQGSGIGGTQIDLAHRRMVKAHAEFDVPPPQKGRIKASWRETVHVELAN
jgi:hypothetical protein